MHHDRVWFISGIHCWLNIGKWIDTIYLIKQQQQKTPHGHSNRGSPLLPSKSIEHNPVSVSNTYYWQTGIERISATFYRVSAKKPFSSHQSLLFLQDQEEQDQGVFSQHFGSCTGSSSQDNQERKSNKRQLVWKWSEADLIPKWWDYL